MGKLRQHWHLLGIAGLVALGAFALSAVSVGATVDHKSLAQLTAEARTIIVGDVTAMQSRWNAEHTLIFTDVAIRVKQVVKGDSPGAEIVIPVPGGQVGEQTAIVSDVPTFEVGQETVLFLRDGYFQVVGWHQGKFTVEDGIVVGKQRPLGVFLGQIRQIDEALRRGQRPEEIHIGDEPDAPASPAAVPQITSIAPTSGPAKNEDLTADGTCPVEATAFTITGSNFGATQGAGRVRFWRVDTTYYNACITSWSNTVIKGRVPGAVSSSNVNVITSGGTSNGVPFAVTFSYGGGRWWADTIPTTVGYRINDNTLDTTQELTATNKAATTWNNVASADFNFRYDGKTTKKDAAQDGTNVISWVGTDTGAVATAWKWRSSDHTKSEFDIVFNDKSYTWGTDGNSLKMDVQNIATHELGHALGLMDLYGSPDDAKTMYGYSWNGMTIQRTLETDDIAGVSFLYPAAPTGLKATGGADKISLTWTAVPGAATYEIYRNTTNNSSTAQYASEVSTPSYQDTGLLHDKTYYYWVKVRNSNDYQAWESKFSSAASAVMTCPTGKFTAKYYANQTLSGDPAFSRCETMPFDYNWGSGGPRGDMTDGFSARWKGVFSFLGAKYRFTGGGDDGFRLSLDGTWIFTDWSNHSYREKYVDRTVTAGNHTIIFEYYEKDSSARAKARWDKFPTAPTGVTASDGTYTDKIRVKWTAAVGVTGYKVYRNTSNNTGSAALKATLTGTTWDDTSTTDGKTYWYWVKSYNVLGDSGFSTGNSGYR